MTTQKSSIPRIPKAHFILRDEIVNSNGESPIYITYSLERKTAKASTGIYVKKNQWDSVKSKILRSHPRHQQLNSYLQLKRHEIDTRILDTLAKREIDINILRLLIKEENIDKSNGVSIDFVDFAINTMEKEYKREIIGISVLNNAKCSLHLFRKFLHIILHRDHLPVTEIDEDTVDEYIVWRKDHRENTNETINKSLTPIFKAVRTAHSRGYISMRTMNEICSRYLPATKPSIDEEIAGEKVNYLTQSQLQEFIELYSKVKYDRTRDYMDMFLFSFHACGLRFVDILTLQWSNIDFDNNQLHKVLVKSKISHTIPLTLGARTILEKWKGRIGCNRFCFGLLPSDFDLKDDSAINRQRLNKNRAIITSLQEIGRKLNLPFNLTIHCARHTFAVLYLNREENPLPVHMISRLLGHSSILVTEKVYARFIPQKLEADLDLNVFSTLTPS